MIKHDGIKTYSNEEALDALADHASRVVGNIVEIGVYQGGSLRRIAEATDAHVYGIDTWGLEGAYASGSEDPEKYGVANMFRAEAHVEGLLNVTLIRGFSDEVADDWYRTVDMLYIDAEHTYDAVIRDFLAWRPHLEHRAIVAFDDYRSPRNKPVKDAVDKLVADGFISVPRVYGGRLAVSTA